MLFIGHPPLVNLDSKVLDPPLVLAGANEITTAPFQMFVDLNRRT